MKQRFAILMVAILLCSVVGSPAFAADAALPFIQAHGTEFQDASGKRVILKGCNLGNWLIIEPWMLGGCIEAQDQAHLFSKLNERFGADPAKSLMDSYRSSYITPRDFEIIRSFGFNVVRLPIDYRLLQRDEPPYALKEDGFKWLDRAVDMAESSGTYIILDLHSAPGGQSNDQCTGEAGQNKLWNNPVNQNREVEIWRAIAARFRNRSVIAGYDIMNEPYADHHMDVRGQLKTIMSDCYTAIRATGDQHVMFFPGALGSPPTFYGDPHTNNWTNVGFTEHFYPGLFGSKVAFESHVEALTKTMPARQEWLDRIQSPYYIGEFNPVLDSTGGTRVTRAYYDTCAQHGWAGTLWSYKLVKPTAGASSNTWYCVSNAKPLPKLSLESSSYEDFAHFISSLATEPLASNQPLLNAVTRADPEPLPLPAISLPQGISSPAAALDIVEKSLLKNGSFEETGTTPDLAASWTRLGAGFNRETTWTPTHSGNAELGYHHWEIDSKAPSEMWQEVPVQPGKRYRFAIFVLGDDPKASHNFEKVELKLEGHLGGNVVTLNSTALKATEIGVGDKWTRAVVDGTALGDTMKARIIVTPAANAPRGGAVKFDDAVLQLLGGAE